MEKYYNFYLSIDLLSLRDIIRMQVKRANKKEVYYYVNM